MGRAIPAPGIHARSVRHNAIVSKRLQLELSIYPIIDESSDPGAPMTNFMWRISISHRQTPRQLHCLSDYDRPGARVAVSSIDTTL